MKNADGTEYALDLLTPIRHVATQLGIARPQAIPFGDLVKDCPVNHGDLSRVILYEAECQDEQQAKRWVTRRAVEELKKVKHIHAGDSYQLIVPFRQLRYQGEKLTPYLDIHANLKNPFGKGVGQFEKDIRTVIDTGSLEDLRESMRAFGWVPELPAVQDEYGVVIMGHRRLQVAAELGIEPIIKVVTFGDGDPGDAERFRLAIASNIAFKPLTAKDRKRIAEYLYGTHEWRENRIAEALNVSQQQISRDLSELLSTSNSDEPRKRGAKTKLSLEQKKIAYQRHEAGETYQHIADDLGVSRNTVREAVMEMRSQEASPNPTPTPAPRPAPTPAPSPPSTPTPTPSGLDVKYWEDRIAGVDASAHRFAQEVIALSYDEQQQLARMLELHLRLKVA